MPLNLAAPPLQTPIIESAREPLITKVWAQWLRSLSSRAEQAAYAITSAAVALTGQSASIGVTSLIPLASGLYRVNWAFRVTTIAGVASSLQLSITHTDDGVVCVQNTSTYAGNLTTQPQSGSFVVKCDASSPLSYSTTYASNPAAAMLYKLDIKVEQL